MSPLIFEDPGPPTGNAKPSAEHLLAAHELRQRDGEFAVIKTGLTQSQAAGLAARVRRGEIIAYGPRGTFTAVTRRQAGGKYKVLACHGLPLADREPAPVAEPTPIRRARKAAGSRG